MKAPTAYDFAQVRGGRRTFAFGLDRKRAAEALRALAAAVEAEDVLLQKVTSANTATNRDFTVTTLTVEFAEPVVEAEAPQLVMCPGGCATERLEGAVCPECRVAVPGAPAKPARKA